ncbi:hypothetical protein BD769DRAFT_1393409 [Suillus cothurnatus]|nr:hypothetical protein BD769DRAFT_1393409 [Suillus cothurnatus]
MATFNMVYPQMFSLYLWIFSGAAADVAVQLWGSSQDTVQYSIELEKSHASLEMFEKIIPRPPGALSKPTAGGYALKDVLGWEDVTYNHAHGKALKEFPALANYVDHWPARDFAKMYMKNINAQHKANQGSVQALQLINISIHDLSNFELILWSAVSLDDVILHRWSGLSWAIPQYAPDQWHIA